MGRGGVNLASLFATEPAELRARLRSLRMASRLLCGPRGTELECTLHDAAEHDADALPMELLDALQAARSEEWR